ERGIQRAQADTIFELLAKFADYGFNKSHAAAYALLSYQTAYMKAHYPVEFLAASMTLDLNNTDKLSEFRAEAQRLGIKVEAPSMLSIPIARGCSPARRRSCRRASVATRRRPWGRTTCSAVRRTRRPSCCRRSSHGCRPNGCGANTTPSDFSCRVIRSTTMRPC